MTSEFHATLGQDTSLSLSYLSGVFQKFLIWALIDGLGLPFLNLFLLIKHIL